MPKPNFQKLPFFIILFCLTSSIIAQESSKKRVHIVNDIDCPVNIGLLSQSGRHMNLQDKLMYCEQYNISEKNLKYIQSNPQVHILTPVRFKGVTYDLDLSPNFLKTESYKKVESNPTESAVSKAYFYKGSITGQKGWATLAIVDNTLRLVIAHPEGNIEINKIGADYLGYMQADIKQPLHYECDMIDDKKPVSNITSQQRQTADCLELYIECDHQSYLDNSSSSTLTENWALILINDVSAIYDMLDISLVVSEIFIHTSADPYANLSNKTNIRNEFIDQVQGNYNGRIAYLFSTRDLDGGIAYGIGGYCAMYPDFPGPYALAGSLSSTTNPLPVYSFNTHVIAHELGHVLGSRHTHACVWNGDNTQIDDCGNVWATNNSLTPEGANCYDDQSPILPTEGGIMSLCELIAGVGVNLANGFGLQPGNLIKDNYENAICSTGGLCASIPPSNDFCNSAIRLNPKTYCVPERFDNFKATHSGIIPTCASIALDDVWFSYRSNGSNTIINLTALNNFSTPFIAVYEGNCGSLSEISCTATGSSSLSINVNSVPSGVDIFIQIMERSNSKGEFDICITDASADCHPYDGALLDLYNNTNGANWTNNQGWSSSITSSNCNVCDWYGIVCDQNDNIIEIDLSFNNLAGSVPQSLDQITTLRKLDFYSNQLTGTMPDLWEDMLDLEYLDLSANSFSGIIPRSVLGLSHLSTLYLENNNLTDSLPEGLGLLPSIEVLWVKNNNLYGCWPNSFVNICDITSKSFTGNQNLPREGNLNLYCMSGIGADIDGDGYCSGDFPSEDCDDDHNLIYPNAPEICDGRDNNCDGIIDENLTSSVDWIGGGSGLWTIDSNWSSGLVPRACEDVNIQNAIVSISNGQDAFARSLTLGEGTSLTNDGNLFISGSDDIGMKMEVNSNCTNNSSIHIDYITNIGLELLGEVMNFGTIAIKTVGLDEEVVIKPGGLIENIGENVVLSK